MEYLKFLFHCKGTVIVKHHAKNMPIFNNCDHFFDVMFGRPIYNLFKKWSEIVQMISEHKFWLEVSPDSMILRTAWSKQDFFL